MNSPCQFGCVGYVALTELLLIFFIFEYIRSGGNCGGMGGGSAPPPISDVVGNFGLSSDIRQPFNVSKLFLENVLKCI